MRRTSPTLPLLVALPLLATLLLVVHISQGPHRTALVATQQASQAQAQSHLFWGDALKDDDESGEWRDSDEHLQSMANDALDLCDEVMAGGQQQEASRVKHCVHRVVPEELTRFWHTPAGLDDWTQPTKAKDEWGDEVAVGREHNYARSLQKIIDQFQPHTSWEGKKIYEDGKMVYIPRYDRSAFQGYSGADTRASFLFNTKAGNQEAFKSYQVGDSNDDESYDVLYTEKMPMQAEGGRDGQAAAEPAVPPGALRVMESKQRRSSLRRTGVDPLMQYAMKHSKAAVRKARGSVSRKMKEGAANTQRLWEVMPTIYAGLPAAPAFPYPSPYPAAVPFPAAPFPAAPFPAAPAFAPGQVSVVGKASPASVEPAVVVEQPWASSSHLSTETNIAEDQEGDPDSYHVTVQGLPIGCDAGGVRAQWEGDLKVSEVNCDK
mmetsp:Transcript_6169/g.14238  ORF Transcript_6169/g.14238 Transcript_6169/m.14238 type:complete len:434 (-) Transcript_6169:101-1402(-)